MDKLLRAGDFSCETINIITTSGNVIDITKITDHIEIYENIYTSGFNGNIVLRDTKNITAIYPIVGQERLEIQLSTPQDKTKDIGHNEINFLKSPLYVYKVDNIQDENDASKYIFLKFCSIETINNHSNRLSKSYTGNISSMVEKIYRDSSSLDSTKNLFIQDTIGNHKYIAPNVRPYSLIENLAKRAVSSDNHFSYVFFETTQGHHFASIDYLMSQNPVFQYNEYTDATLTQSDIMKQLFSVRSYEIYHAKDTIESIIQGQYSSNLLVTDIHNKSYKKYKYDCAREFDNELHTDEDAYPYFSESIDPNIKRSLNENYTSAFYMVSNTDSKLYSDGENYPYKDNERDDKFIKRIAKLQHMRSSIKLHIEIFGITKIKVGDVISINIRNKSSANDEIWDPVYSGNYLITKLKHRFDFNRNRTHICQLEVVKDSISHPIPSENIKVKVGDKFKTYIYK